MGNLNLISIGQLCDHGFTATFTSKEVSLTGPNITLTGTHKIDNGLYYIDLQKLKPAPTTHLPQHYLCSNNVHTLSTKLDIIQYLHRAAFSPIVSSWTTAITAVFYTTWPVLKSALVRTHLPKSIATAKGHLRQDRQNVRSTRNTYPATTISNPPVMTTPPLPLQEDKVRTQMAYLQTIELTGKVSTDQIGRFPVTSSQRSRYLMVLYDHDSNEILAKPITSRNRRKLIQSTRVLHAYLSYSGLTPQYQLLDNECPSGLKTFLRETIFKFQLVPPYLHHTNTEE